MRIFAVDCSAKSASVAISEDEKILSEAYTNTGLTHSQTLMPMAMYALECASIELSSIDVFAISAGPGSFTGIRIGVAAIKGLTLAQNKPCFPVSTLEAIAYNLKGQNCIACAVMDARCEQVYTALFKCCDNKIERLTQDSAMKIVDLEKNLKDYDLPVIFVGDGALLCYNSLSDRIHNCSIASEHIRYQCASGVAACAFEKLKNNDSISGDKLFPVYLRPPQAERELKRRKEISNDSNRM